jgi:hypothetical protein
MKQTNLCKNGSEAVLSQRKGKEMGMTRERQNKEEERTGQGKKK